MTDTPKFEVIDRRKYKAEEEERGAASTSPSHPAKEETRAGPQLVAEAVQEAEPVVELDDVDPGPELPPPPSADEMRAQKMAYDTAAQRLEEIIRAQNPGMGPQPAVTFEQLVQQFYVSAMIQMGAGTQEGQRPRVDILGAKQTIELMGILADKTRGNLSEAEERTLQAVLYEVRFAFVELTGMITLQGMQPPMPTPGKR